MTNWRDSVCVVLALVVCGVNAQTVLRRDVFAPPTAFSQTNSALAKVAVPAEVDVVVQEAKVWLPRLSSVVSAGKNSMAVVNGTVMKLNDSIDGFQLIQVGLGEAVFSKDGEQIVVNMKRISSPGNTVQAKDRQ